MKKYKKNDRVAADYFGEIPITGTIVGVHKSGFDTKYSIRIEESFSMTSPITRETIQRNRGDVVKIDEFFITDVISI